MSTNLKFDIITNLEYLDWDKTISSIPETLRKAVQSVKSVMDNKLIIALGIGDIHEIAHNNGREFSDETALKVLRKIEAKKDMWKETLEDILWDEIEDTPPDKEHE